MSPMQQTTAAQLDNTYHYPPELLELLIETIPLLIRSKAGVLDFFQGAGVPSADLAVWPDKVRKDKKSVNKFQIVPSVLCRLNDRQDAALAPRREIIKRVSGFDDFSTCWENDQLKARGLVSQIREVVNVKDSFTRMNLERERERAANRAAASAQLQVKQRKRQEIEQVKADFYALFAITDPHKRGKALEAVLNRLFACYGILVKEAFIIKGHAGQGVIEQVDGLVELDGHTYLVEMKWWSEPIGREQIAPHLVSIYSRGDVRGIFISSSAYTDGAIADCTHALQQKVVVLCHIEELVMLLEQDKDLKQLLRAKVRAAQIDRTPFIRCLEGI